MIAKATRSVHSSFSYLALAALPHSFEENMVLMLPKTVGFRHGFRTATFGILVTATCAAGQTQLDSSAPATPTQKPPATEASVKGQCIDIHRQAQRAQNEDKLVEARDLAKECTALACPGLILNDCARWLNDMDQRIPSVVFDVKLDGKPSLNAEIFVDEKPATDWTRGEALKLNPGEHQFRFVLGNNAPIVQSLILAEGMRYRVVSADFKTDSPTPASSAQPSTAPRAPLTEPLTPSAPTPKSRPTPAIVYPLLGLGAAGLGGFAVFALLGKSKQNDLDNTCKPNCTDDDLSPMKTKYLIGDIALGVGAASLVAASFFYFGRPEKPPSAHVGLAPLPGGAAASAYYHF